MDGILGNAMQSRGVASMKGREKRYNLLVLRLFSGTDSYFVHGSGPLNKWHPSHTASIRGAREHKKTLLRTDPPIIGT